MKPNEEALENTLTSFLSELCIVACQHTVLVWGIVLHSFYNIWISEKLAWLLDLIYFSATIICVL